MPSIRLFKGAKILEDENFIVEDINDYLSEPNFSSLTMKSFTIQVYDTSKMDVTINIKAESEGDRQGEIDGNNYNYALVNTGTKRLFYFIRKISYIAPMTYEVQLHLDVLNSFYNRNYISPLTHITRQHKDRFKRIDIYQGFHGYFAHIDEYSEGITPKLFKDLENDVIQKMGDYDFSASFYLIYKNSKFENEDNNVVNCFLAFEGRYKYEVVESGTITPEKLNQSFTYFIFPYFTSDIRAYEGSNLVLSISQNTADMVIVNKIGDRMRVKVLTYSGAATPPFDTSSGEVFDTMENITSIEIGSNSRMYYDTTNILFNYPSRQYVYENYSYVTAEDTIERYLTPYANINRADARIIKVLKLPYLPGMGFYEDENDKLVFDSDKWIVNTEENLLQLNDITSALIQYDSFGEQDYLDDNNNQYEDDPLMLYPLSAKNYDNENISKSLEDMRNAAPEPKLYHSDYFYWKYIYDSFTKVIQNEKYMNYPYANERNSINFYVTSTINSNFMFKFNFMGGQFIEEDYEKYLVIQRNNEETLYNSEYINYIKSGFNYDVKNKQRQEAFSWVATGASMVAGIASVAVGSKTLGVGLISSSAMGIASSINTTIQLETNMEQRLNQLKYQSASVYGADDVDLMTEYNHNNKLWRARYKVSPRMETALKDLFYYTGYIDNVHEIPVTNTRMWFNYLQCEIHFKSNPHMNKEQLEEFKGKFLGGVTFLHSNVVGGLQQWDFDRERENWERVFFTNN